MQVPPGVMCSEVWIASLVRQLVDKSPAVLSALTQCQRWRRERHSAWQLREGMALTGMHVSGSFSKHYFCMASVR